MKRVALVNECLLVAVWEKGEQRPEPLRPVNSGTEDVREQGQDEKSVKRSSACVSNRCFVHVFCHHVSEKK